MARRSTPTMSPGPNSATGFSSVAVSVPPASLSPVTSSFTSTVARSLTLGSKSTAWIWLARPWRNQGRKE
jgi:hypothetical protein